jgi:hypothetical protein
MVPLLLCCVTPQDQQKVKGETKKEKGKRTSNSYCRFPYNDNCWRKFSKVNKYFLRSEIKLPLLFASSGKPNG